MPTYSFYNTKTKKHHDKFLSFSERDEYLAAHPNLNQVPSSPLLHSGRGLDKPEGGFRDVLRNIKSKHRGSNIDTF